MLERPSPRWNGCVSWVYASGWNLGTGYSSLAYLQRLPVDEVKIDQSFVASFPDSSAQAVVSAIVDLGHRLGHRVVAEGVEDLEAFELLRRPRLRQCAGLLAGSSVVGRPPHRAARQLVAAGTPGPAAPGHVTATPDRGQPGGNGA